MKSEEEKRKKKCTNPWIYAQYIISNRTTHERKRETPKDSHDKEWNKIKKDKKNRRSDVVVGARTTDHEKTQKKTQK